MSLMDKEAQNLLYQCLAAVSMADGELDSREIATQLSVIEQFTGVSPDAGDVVAASIDMGEWQDFAAILEAKRSAITTAFSEQIIKACIMIGRADDQLQSAEFERIQAIATAFGFSDAEFEALLKVIR